MNKLSTLTVVASLLMIVTPAVAHNCSNTVIGGEPKILVQPVTDTNWLICLLHRKGSDDGKASVRLTIRESVPFGSDNTNEFRVNVIMSESIIEPHLEECAIYGVKGNEELAVVHSGGVPTEKIIKICRR